VYAATGVLTVHTDRGTSVVPANRVAWTPAGNTHWHRAHGDTDMRIVFLPPSLAARIPDRPAVFLATGLAREVLLSLTASPGDGRAAPRHDGPARARLLRVLVDDNTSMADLGKAIGASSRTLSRLLRKEFGMTFHEWRTHLRIYHALVLLAEGRDVTQTAYACGWANPSGFIAAFATIVGTTPGRYQGGHRSGARAP
jgi:AraC-like DNA-binding protein